MPIRSVCFLVHLHWICSNGGGLTNAIQERRFFAANTTKPFKSGTVLPATCSVGEAFFKSNALAGSNLYGCTSLNSWTCGANSLCRFSEFGICDQSLTGVIAIGALEPARAVKIFHCMSASWTDSNWIFMHNPSSYYVPQLFPHKGL